MLKSKISLKKKIAVVTGSTRGIGKAIADLLVTMGAQVIYTGTKPSTDIKRRGKCYLRLDLADNASISEFLEKIKKFPRIDILINNAGINAIEPINDLTEENWNRIVQVNLTGAMRLMKAVSQMMIEKQTRGKILNVSSIFGVVSKAKRNAYSASKTGMIGLTRASALDLAPHNILVNALCPGFVATDLTRSILSPKELQSIAQAVPLKRLGKEEEIARVAAFLCSDLNSFMTGQTVVADGGFVIR